MPGPMARLTPFLQRGEPVGYALLRAWLGVTLFTHGYPKLLHLPHGGSPDAFANLVEVIGGKMHLPAAGALSMLVALLETFGAAMLAVGLATRLVAAAFAFELLVIAFGVHWPAWEWTDKGMEYPLLMAALAAYMVLRGGGRFAIHRRFGEALQP